MPWTVANPPKCALHWTDAEKAKCVSAANATLKETGDDAQAIYACIHAAGKSTRKGANMDKLYFVNGMPVTLRSLVKAYINKKKSELPKDVDDEEDEEKSSPTANDVHVPGVDEDEEEMEKSVEILKTDDEKHLVYGAVLVPNKPDSQGDVASCDEIEKAAHTYLANKLTRQLPAMDEQHKEALSVEDARPVESYVLLQDLSFGEKTLPKGTWVMAAHLPSKDRWEKVKKGEIKGFSIKGIGKRKRVANG